MIDVDELTVVVIICKMKKMTMVRRVRRGIGLIESFRIFGASCGCLKIGTGSIAAPVATGGTSYRDTPAKNPRESSQNLSSKKKRKEKYREKRRREKKKKKQWNQPKIRWENSPLNIWIPPLFSGRSVSTIPGIFLKSYPK